MRARELFREAVRKDPQFCEAHMWLARVSVLLAVYGWVDDCADALAEAHRAALRAIELDERDPYSHYALSMACMYSGAHDAAIRAATRCVELSPSFALGHAALGQALLSAGRAAQALEPLEYSLRLTHTTPRTFIGGASWLSRACCAEKATARWKPRCGRWTFARPGD